MQRRKSQKLPVNEPNILVMNLHRTFFGENLLDDDKMIFTVSQALHEDFEASAL